MLFLIQVHSVEMVIVASEVHQVLSELTQFMPDFLSKHFEDGTWPEVELAPARLKLKEVLDIN